MMQQALVVLLVVFVHLQSVSAQNGAQENHSNKDSEQPTVLNIDHYLLQLNSKLDMLDISLEALKTKLEILDGNLLEHKQDTSAELAQLHLSIATTRSSLATLALQMNTKLNLLTSSLSDYKQQSAVEHQTLLTNTNFKLETLNTSLAENKQETTAELAQLQTSLTSTNSKLNVLTATTAQLSTDHRQIQTSISDVECMDGENILQLHQDLQENLTHLLKTLKSHVSESIGPYACGGTEGWRRVVYLDMTDPSTTCPTGWPETGYSKRTCGRVNAPNRACDSVTFPVSGEAYNRVCGRIMAYQYSSTDAFEAYDAGHVTTINGAYVAGVSLTHGIPRQHIWTFAAGTSENAPTRGDVCPCDASITIRVPPFVGNNYFCESGVSGGSWDGFHPDDPLWDGQNCISSSTCCSLNTPPYFVKQLPTSTTDSIEARLCRYDGRDFSAVELIELYVQ